jgi:outer membrane protein OmpA-like peptidoglycan-associated protein
MKFPAPPRDSETIEIFLPGFLPMEEVQLKTGPATEKVEPETPGKDKGIPITTEGLPLAGEVVDIVGLPSVGYAGTAVNIDQIMRDLKGKKVGQEIQVALSSDLLFDFDKWDIKKEAEVSLQKLSKLIKNLKKSQVVIEGHTDAKGSDKYNLNLSQKRAQAVKAWLQSKGGLKKAKFQVQGSGEAKPVAPNRNPDGSDNPKGRAQNRRVEIRILD